VIAKVRIAPVERWCEKGSHRLINYPEAYVPGTLVGVHTESMTSWVNCNGRVWLLTLEDSNRIRESCGLGPTDIAGGLCEHMLEMD
jgi:hypothetical protein